MSIRDYNVQKKPAILLLDGDGWRVVIPVDTVPPDAQVMLREMRVPAGIKNIVPYLLDLYRLVVPVSDTQEQRMVLYYHITTSNGERFVAQAYHTESVSKYYCPYNNSLPYVKSFTGWKKTQRTRDFKKYQHHIGQAIPALDMGMYACWLNDKGLDRLQGFPVEVDGVPFIWHRYVDSDIDRTLDNVRGRLISAAEERPTLPESYRERVVSALFPSGKNYKWLWRLAQVRRQQDVVRISTPYGESGILYSDVLAVVKRLTRRFKVDSLQSLLHSNWQWDATSEGHKVLDCLLFGLAHMPGRLGRKAPGLLQWKPVSEKDTQLLHLFIIQAVGWNTTDTWGSSHESGMTPAWIGKYAAFKALLHGWWVSCSLSPYPFVTEHGVYPRVR